MARDYWVETDPSGRQRFVKAGLRRSNTHDGSQSSRSRRVDFLDVTREEYNALLAEERRLRQTNERILQENQTYKVNWQSCDDEVRRLRGVVPSLETTIRSLEYENGQLRARLGERERHAGRHHHHQESREREDELRRIRYKNTKLRNDNESLLARVGRLERDLRGGVGDRARKLAEEVFVWRRRFAKLEDDEERLIHKLDAVEKRNNRLQAANESLARQDRKLQQELDYYQSLLRRHGITVR